jgi:microcystin-dependent protein
MADKSISKANLELALSENNKKIKEHVSQKTNKINQISIAQKTVNTELDNCFCKLENDYVPVVGEYVPFKKTSGSFEINNGRVIVKPGQRVQINVSLSYNENKGTAANIVYFIKDYTNDIKITQVQPYRGAIHNEYACSQTCQYTNDTDKDCEIGLYVDLVQSSDTLLYLLTSMTVQEIGRSILIDPVEHVNRENGLEDTPIGHIISCMSNEAPKHYLVCDGTEYSITDYPHLAQHFENEFGTVNYFGGDGIDTFCVPDLRGEFLRGTGDNSHESQGSGSEVGKHQDGTEHLYLRTDGNTGYVGSCNGVTQIEKQDSIISLVTTMSAGGKAFSWVQNIPGIFTSRPTNTSVLYCIKYEPTYYMNVYNPLAVRDETVLWEGEQGSATTTVVTNNFTLVDSYKNYDYIGVRLLLKIDNGTSLRPFYKEVPTQMITDMIDAKHPGYSINLSWGYGNSDDYSDIQNTSTETNFVINQCRSSFITKIVGIRYQETQSDSSGDESGNIPGPSCNCPTYTNEEVEMAIDEILTDIIPEENEGQGVE